MFSSIKDALITVPLRYAFREKNRDMLLTLMPYVSETLASKLIRDASESGDIGKVKFIIHFSALSPCKKMCLHSIALHYGTAEVKRDLIMNNRNKFEKVINAARYGFFDIVEDLANDPDIDKHVWMTAASCSLGSSEYPRMFPFCMKILTEHSDGIIEEDDIEDLFSFAFHSKCIDHILLIFPHTDPHQMIRRMMGILGIADKCGRHDITKKCFVLIDTCIKKHFKYRPPNTRYAWGDIIEYKVRHVEFERVVNNLALPEEIIENEIKAYLF